MSRKVVSMSITKLRKWGNGQGVLLSTPLMKKMKFKLNDQFKVSVDNDGNIILSPLPKETGLAKLFANSKLSGSTEVVKLNPTENEIY